ncbi:hypothetical protein ACI2J4_12635 [Agrobacterium tumefaciens]|uniref:hypothetical protein n=1 Tax=Agrobacterium tumefaciens TaxID=358 RepID=UPI0038517520
MAKDIKIVRNASSGKILTQPIGVTKATKFAEVEGMKKSLASSALSQRAASSGLKGDAYRKEIVKAFKKA